MATERIISLGNGGGRDYATLALAFAGTEIQNRISNDEFIIVEVYNDNDLAIVGSGAVANGGTATHTVTVRPAYQHDYANNNFASTALKYDPSLGAALETTGAFGILINLPANSFVEFRSMQLACSNDDGRVTLSGDFFSGFVDCLIRDNGQGDSSASNYTNCLMIRDANLTQPILSLNYSNANQCTMVVPADLSPSGSAVGFSGTSTANECAVFGGATAFSSSSQAGSNYNASDDASSPGASSLDNQVFADQFENVNNATQDWRRKAGNDLDGAGAGGIDIGFTIPATIPAPVPNIGDVDTDGSIRSDQTNISINGSTLAGITGVTLTDGTSTVAQTIIGSPTEPEVVIDAVQGVLPFGALTLEVTDGSNPDTEAVTLTPPTLNDYVALVNPGTDATTVFFNATTTPQTGDQVEWVKLTTNGHTVTITPSGSFSISGGTGVDSFSIRWRETATDTWGAWATMDLENAILSANPVAATTEYNIALSVPVATILAAATAGEGGALSLSSVTPGANCASAVINGANVDMTPSDNVSGLMVVSYTVSEAGAGTANSVINTTINVINPAVSHVVVFNSTSTVELDVTRPSNNLTNNSQNAVTVT